MGRNEGENNQLAQLARAGDDLFSSQKVLAGPTALARGVLNQELIFLSSQIISAYTDVMGLEKIEVLYRQIPSTEDNVHQISPLPKARFAYLFI